MGFDIMVDGLPQVYYLFLVHSLFGRSENTVRQRLHFHKDHCIIINGNNIYVAMGTPPIAFIDNIAFFLKI